MSDFRISPDLVLPEREIQFRFSASPGPGGQNVNRVNTRVELRFDLRASQALNKLQKDRLLRFLGTRLSSMGILIVRSSRYRSQGRNREDCLYRFAGLMAKGLQPPPPPRKKPRPSRAAQARRLQQKRNHSLKKVLRRKPSL